MVVASVSDFGGLFVVLFAVSFSADLVVDTVVDSVVALVVALVAEHPVAAMAIATAATINAIHLILANVAKSVRNAKPSC
jgi:multisubunit Na+/H+ antiporter MnhG subunit